MTRVISGAALLLLAVIIVWFAPAPLFLLAALGLLTAASLEYAHLAQHSGLAVSASASTVAAGLTGIAFSRLLAGSRTPPFFLDVALMAAFLGVSVVVMFRWRSGSDALAVAAATMFPALYLGLPIGALIAIRGARGREALALLMLTVIVSDTGQYYAGRLFGRRLLAPAISPKKTVAGAAGGFVCGALLFGSLGSVWLPAVPLTTLLLLGTALVAMGIAGDLFESMLKRSVGLKDSSTLIPGHGGVLDRIDALLFAAPFYYVVLKYL